MRRFTWMALLMAGCSNPWHLSAPSTSQRLAPTPAAEGASIVFVWPSVEARGYAVNIVASATHQVLGQLDGGEWTAVSVPAGEVELYLAPGHRTLNRIPRPLPELVTGEVAAGRTYVVHYEPQSGTLEVLETGSPRWAQLPEWLETSTRVECNQPLAARYSNERGAALHAAHTAARERFLSLNSSSRARRTLHPFPRQRRRPPRRFTTETAARPEERWWSTSLGTPSRFAAWVAVPPCASCKKPSSASNSTEASRSRRIARGVRDSHLEPVGGDRATMIPASVAAPPSASLWTAPAPRPPT